LNPIMLFDPESGSVAFDKLGRYLGRLEKKPAPKSVHRFRTYSRRVETILRDLVAEPSGNQKKVLRLLERLRKKAGKLRDLDVQLAALRSLKIPQEPDRRARLTRTLLEERAKRERKLPKVFSPELVRQLRKRLKRAAKGTELPPQTDPLAKALRLFADVGKAHAPITESKLHEFRLAAKRARYLAELAGDNSDAARVLKELQHLQDVIGDWHDWLQLAERARQLFGSVQESALVAALHNITRAKFRQSLQTLSLAQAALLRKPVTAETVSPQKRSTAA
jgi:CHAD domain-containing protein